MWPGEVPSDGDVNECPEGELRGRMDILQDIRSDNQGSAGAYALMGVLVPALLAVSVISGFTDDTPIGTQGTLIALVVIFIGCMAIAAYSFIWFRWADHRLKIVEKLLEDRHDNLD